MSSDEKAVGPVESAAADGEDTGEGTTTRRPVTVFLGTVLHFSADPWVPGHDDEDDPLAYHLFDPGALVVRDGRVAWAGHDHECPREFLRQGHVVDHRGCLIVPGFVDPHIHSGQVDSVASPGGQLLPWLRDYMYRSEMRFVDAEYARAATSFFFDRLLECGTTTACVYTTTHPHATDAFFSEAYMRKLRMISGKLLMDDDNHGSVPEEYLDGPVEEAEEECRRLIKEWHHTGRLLYAVSPRFALTSTLEALQMAGRLYHESRHTDRPLWVQSHLAENQDEVQAVIDKFRDTLDPRSYLDVYDKCGLVGPRSIWGHSVWIDDGDRALLADTGAGAAFNPTSNLFLGSGLFDLDGAGRAKVRVGLGTDVGGGTSYSMLQTMNEAYKTVALANTYPHPSKEKDRKTLTALRAFYLATLGGARALHLDHLIGSFHRGREADFVVLDWAATPLLERRTEVARDFRERLFVLATLGDDRAVTQTYVLGEPMLRRCRPR
ncbi:guanine deaminase [Streptomyces palmae]|uniref:Guanine deaminase n=1 Tax=Streptomyces palmae TaxID=1701085 RepID=A0A4Z0H5K8_9ACTN|nr:guanine deaminase [Streptomyces palmae]TGB06797.1 guanine deaminase [Streptomyces palmae]